MPQLGMDQIRRFLSRNDITAHFGTVGPRNEPYVVAIWYEYDGEYVYLIPRARSKHARNLKRKPEVCLYVDLVEPPYTRILINGEAEILEEGPLSSMKRGLEIATRMSERYLGEKGPTYLQPTLPYPRLLVRMKPRMITGWEGFDWPQWHKQ